MRPLSRRITRLTASTTAAVTAVALSASLGSVLGAGLDAASASAAPPAGYVADPASYVNPLIGTSGQVNTFPGADYPFGMMQLSPDTTPDRTPGGGYEYADSALRGFSLTHISGPGCGAFGDVPMLPVVGGLPDQPSDASLGFSHATERAGAGSYSVSTANGVRTDLAALTHSGLARFAFPRSSQASLLLKLSDGDSTVDATSAHIVGDDEVVGSVTGGHFCGQSTSAEDDYTLHFDITFDHPFEAHGVWSPASADRSRTKPGERRLSTRAPRSTGSAGPSASRQPRTTTPSRTTFAGPRPHVRPTTRPAPRVHDGSTPMTHQQQSPQALSGGRSSRAAADTGPSGAYVTFDARQHPTVTAKIGISFTNASNAAVNVAQEIRGFDVATVRQRAHDAWNRYLERVQIGGASHTQAEQFYTAMYHSLLHPNVFSDVNGQYLGFDGRVHRAPTGHAEYANFSGWDIYRSQVQLAAMVAPHQTSDIVTSALNQYDQMGQLPKWALANGESYVMVGDPSDPIIADAYAFGARDFDVHHALAAMVDEATNPNRVRPGQATLDAKGYLPLDKTYGCCNFYGPVSTQLEYDSADYSIAALARATGDHATYRRFATRAQNWENSFNVASGYLQARNADGSWVDGFAPSTGTGFVEGTSAQYTPMVPFNLRALIDARGGNRAWVAYLDSLFTSIDHPSATNADLSNEPSNEIPWEYDYAGAPWKTQQVVREAQQKLYFDAPVGQFGNDDLGAMSSWFVWSELGMYPETPGTSTLALGSPVFPRAMVHLAGGRTLDITAAGAAQDAPYVHGLQVDGTTWTKPWVDYADLARGGTMAYRLATTPDRTWGAAASAAPPSDPTGQRDVLASVAPAEGLILQPGSSAPASVHATNLGDQPTTVTWRAVPGEDLTVSPSSGTIRLGPGQSATRALRVTAGQQVGRESLTVRFGAAGQTVAPSSLDIAVAKAGALWPYFDSVGESSAGQVTAGSYDGSGWNYSAEALDAAGLRRGADVTADGIHYTWPDVAPGELDNITAHGQTIPLAPGTSGSDVGVIGSATQADENGSVGDLRVTYTDGTSSTAPVGFSDWTLGAGGYTPLPGDTVVATMTDRATADGGTQQVGTYVFAASVPTAPGKTIASITLPTPTAGTMHVFDVGVR